MTAPWLALHIFYWGDQDSVIVDLIFPTLRRLRTGHWLARYFLIRYWNGGPHLRVRMQCLQPVGDVEREFRRAVEPFLGRASFDTSERERYAAEAARIYEMERTFSGGQWEGEPLEAIQPSGTIQARPYRFDAERYGGCWAEESTHDHAWASTEIACSVLELTRNSAASRYVFAFHAAAVASRILLDTSESSVLNYLTRFSELETELFETHRDRRWEDRGLLAYGKQGAALDDVRGLIEGRALRAPEFWLVLLGAWREELALRREFLSRARSVDGLHVHPDYLILDATHLFLNRLGMDLTMECYLYYLIAGTLRDRASAHCSDVQGASS
jgi:hypothetical protein